MYEQSGAARSGEPNSPPPGSTSVPRPSELSTAEKRTALVTVKSKIVQYENILQALEIQQRALEDSLKLVVYPVLTLPYEVISRIFVACLPWHGRVRPAPLAPPLLLAQICGHWREVALGTCELWSSIDLRLGSGINLNGRRSLLENWLFRAKGHPVSLSFRAGGRIIPPELMTSISACAGQLQRLELDGTLEATEIRQLLPLPQFPTLRCIRTQSSDQPLLELLQNAPALCELGLRTLRLPLFPGLELLTHLEINQRISIVAFLDILATLPLLSNLTCGTIESPIGEGRTPRKFMQLVSLHLHSTEYVLAFITLPRLRCLGLGSRTQSELNPFLSFLSRSACILDRLSMSFGRAYVRFSETQITQLLSALCSLKTIDFKLYEKLPLFLSSIDSTPSLLPRLEHLIVSVTPDSGKIDYEDVIDILKARRQSAKLRSFLLKIQYCNLDYPPRHLYPGNMENSAMEELIAGGLEFGIRHEDDDSVEIWPEDSLLAALDECEDFP
ncbi:hypothetical protein C8R43DRAFT_1109833 [Mycena crocata]|nr:hypothetical protein C8R43DRAFT_1109833 [Mycena crocata]